MNPWSFQCLGMPFFEAWERRLSSSRENVCLSLVHFTRQVRNMLYRTCWYPWYITTPQHTNSAPSTLSVLSTHYHCTQHPFIAPSTLSVQTHQCTQNTISANNTPSVQITLSMHQQCRWHTSSAPSTLPVQTTLSVHPAHFQCMQHTTSAHSTISVQIAHYQWKQHTISAPTHYYLV